MFCLKKNTFHHSFKLLLKASFVNKNCYNAKFYFKNQIKYNFKAQCNKKETF